MSTLFANSPDGIRVAYDRSGAGPALVLLHGGGGTRQDWHAAGYVDRLRDSYTVVALDLRGHGESGLPTDPAQYTTDKLGEDILAVADACGVEQFTIWGMSYGGKVGRYLAAHSERVTKLVLMGTPMGLGVSGQRRQQALDFCGHWPPILQAQREGSLDLKTLPQHDQDMLQNFDLEVMLGWVRAMLHWPAIEPADFLCPTLWLVGSEDPYAMATYKEYEASLAGSQVQVQFLQGLDHDQVFDQIDQVLPILLAFTQKQSDLRGFARTAGLDSPAAQLMRGPLDSLYAGKE
jgi:pimeloyl-ACP methyl ester carboxylesterase